MTKALKKQFEAAGVSKIGIAQMMQWLRRLARKVVNAQCKHV